MSANRANSGGVRSLRAMFENQQQATTTTTTTPSSPEPRGRSPTASVTSNGSDSGRTTSKVRASFVAVEPTVRIAAPEPVPAPPPASAPAPTDEPAMSTAAQRRESFSVGTEDADLLEELKQSVSHEKRERQKSLGPMEAVPEQAILPSAAPTPAVTEPKEDEAMGILVDNVKNQLKNKTLSEASADAIETAIDDEAIEDESEPTPTQTPVGGSSPTVAPVTPASQHGGPTDEEGSTANPDKPVSAAEERVTMRTNDPKETEAYETDAPTEAIGSLSLDDQKVIEETVNDTEEKKAEEEAKKDAATPAKPAAAKSNGTAKPASTSKPASKPTPTSARTSRPSIVSTKPSTLKPAAKSSTAAAPKSPSTKPKTPTPPGSSAKSAATKRSPTAGKDTTTKAPTPKTSSGSLKAPTQKTSSSSLKSSSSSTAAKPKPASKAASESGASFKKPRPKSPTKPVKLPSHLTAPTAAFAAKHEEHAATGSAAGLSRKPSTVTRDRTSAVHKPAAPAKKPASRPSLPAQPAHPRPTSRASTSGRAPDDSFLARMMRPTAASASKTHDKTEVKSPPRRSASVKPRSRPEGLAVKPKQKAAEAPARLKGKTNGTEHKKEAKAEEKAAPASTEEGTPIIPLTEEPKPPVPAPESIPEEPAKEEPAPEETAVEAPLPLTEEPAVAEEKKEEEKPEEKQKEDAPAAPEATAAPQPPSEAATTETEGATTQ